MSAGSLRDDDPPVLFIHIAKTAGGTLRQLAARSVGRAASYPDRSVDPEGSYRNSERLVDLPAERLRSLRLISGHFPFSVAGLLPIETRTVTVLREPVDRSISYLKRYKEINDIEEDLEEIYDRDPVLVARFMRNHQTKVFSLEPAETIGPFYRIVDTDRAALTRAKQNLDQVEVVGFQHDFDRLVALVRDRFGWDATAEDYHVSREHAVSASLREKLAAANELDIEFYEYALSTRS